MVLAELDLQGAARVVETLARTGISEYVHIFSHGLILLIRRVFY